MAMIKDQAIVLRRLDYSETSQVLALFTRGHGLHRLIAKGIKRGTKKKFATGIDLLERGEVVFIAKSQGERQLGVLAEWRQVEPYLGLRESLDRWYAGQYAAEITAAMIEEADPHVAVFDGLGGLLAGLAEGARDEGRGTRETSKRRNVETSKPLTTDETRGETLGRVVAYQRMLLMEVGLWPDLTQCLVCGRAAPPGRAAYYSAQQGGLVCSACAKTLGEKRKISAAALTSLRENDFTSESARGAFDMLNYTIGYNIGRPVALAKFL